jgi:hypothetical protein
LFVIWSERWLNWSGKDQRLIDDPTAWQQKVTLLAASTELKDLGADRDGFFAH